MPITDINAGTFIYTGGSFALNLLAPYTTASGKTYFYLDANGNNSSSLINGVTQDNISHDALDYFFNVGGNTTVDARSVSFGGYLFKLPTKAELEALRADSPNDPPTGWGPGVPQATYWAADFNGTYHVLYALNDGKSYQGNVTTTSAGSSSTGTYFWTDAVLQYAAFEVVAPSISFSATNGFVREGISGSQPVVVTANLSSKSPFDVTVPITYSGTATSGTDYIPTSSSITIAAGQTIGSVTFSVLGDTTVESDETVILTMGTPTNASLGANSTFTQTIGPPLYAGAFSYSSGSFSVNLIAPYTTTSGKTYYYLDANGNNSSALVNGATQDYISHDTLDYFFNAGTNTTVDARTVAYGGYIFKLPSKADFDALRLDSPNNPPVGWGPGVPQATYWTADVSGDGHVLYALNDGQIYGRSDSDLQYAAFEVVGTYALSTSAVTVNEGSSITFTLTTTNVPNGTLWNYSLGGTGITASDVVGGSLSGTITVNNNQAKFNVSLASDLTTEGLETLIATVQGQSASVQINDTSTTPPTYTLSANTGNVNEGGTATFNIATTNVANGTSLTYSLGGTGITASDVVGGSLSGTVTVNNNQATFTVSLASDLTTEGPETLKVVVPVDSPSAILDNLLQPSYGFSGDIYVLNSSGKNYVLELNNTSTSFAVWGAAENKADWSGLRLPWHWGFGNFGNIINVADLNGDGYQDFLGRDPSGHVVSFLLDGAWAPDSVLPTPIQSGVVDNLLANNSVNGVLAAIDIVGDSNTDLVLGTETGLHVVKGNGDGTFTDEQKFVGLGYSALPSWAVSVLASDFNNDRKADLAIASGSKVEVLLGDGSGTFTPSYSTILNHFHPPLAVGDLNNDGKNDLIINKQVYLGDGLGGFLPGASIAVPDGRGVYDACIADFNADGFKDVVLALDRDGIILALNDGSGGFSEQRAFGAGLGQLQNLAVVDFNNDGYLDVAASGQLTGTYIFENTGRRISTSVDINDSSRTAVNVSVSPASVDENGVANLVYTFTRTGDPTLRTLDVNFTLSGNASEADYSYGYTSGVTTQTILVGSSTATLVINPTEDLLIEGNETVVVSVASGAGYDIGPSASATGIIVDTTPTYSLSSSVTSASEGDSVVFRVVTTHVVNSTVLTYNLSGQGIATADVGSLVGTAVVNNNQATFTVNLASDLTTEGSETLSATVEGQTASVTIADTSRTVLGVSVSPSSATESGNANLIYTFTRTGDVTNPLTANILVNGSTTTADYAYSGSSGLSQISFAVGSSTATLQIDSLDDALIEGNETVVVNFASGAGYDIGPSASATGTILDTTPTYVLSAGSSSINEGSAVTFMLVTTNVVNGSSLSYTLSGTGITSTDVVGGNLAGSTIVNNNQATFTVNLASDLTTEGMETLVASVMGQSTSINVLDTSSSRVNLTGKAYHWNSHVLLGDATISAQAGMASSVAGISDGNGDWKLEALERGDYAVSAFRSTTDIGSAITSADALAALRLAVGLNPNAGSAVVSPYQFMAADVVGTDGKVTAADALAILRMAVKLPSAPANEWMFVEDTRDFWDEATNTFTIDRNHASWDKSIAVNANSDQNVNLVGILKGDVNGSWSAPANTPDLDIAQQSYFNQLHELHGVPLAQMGLQT